MHAYRPSLPNKFIFKLLLKHVVLWKHQIQTQLIKCRLPIQQFNGPGSNCTMINYGTSTWLLYIIELQPYAHDVHTKVKIYRSVRHSCTHILQYYSNTWGTKYFRKVNRVILTHIQTFKHINFLSIINRLCILSPFGQYFRPRFLVK